MRSKEELSAYAHAQRSEEWFRARQFAANSSAYMTYFNRFGNREEALERTVNETFRAASAQSNYYMNFGSAFEDTSGYLFSKITGVEYDELGSVPHKEYPRIRGSVDGYGRGVFDEAIGAEDFILETKTPVKRKPTDALHNLGYRCQIIQNIEILDADVGIFNDVELLPMTFEDITAAEPCAHLADAACSIRCEFQRFNLAANSSITAVACKVDANACASFPGKTYGDSLAGMFADETLFSKQLAVTKYTPIAFTDARGEREWLAAHTRPDILIMRPVTVNIQRIERDQKYWRETMLPVALQWIADVDARK